MTAWVGQLLKGLGIEQKGSNINYLRKAVATEYHLHNPNAQRKIDYYSHNAWVLRLI
jgi:hypothetical protein